MWLVIHILIWVNLCYINPLWPSGAIWRHGSGSTLAQVMACCLTAPSHYLNQCWLIISDVWWHFLEMPPPSITKIRLSITYKIAFKCSMGQWVKRGLRNQNIRNIYDIKVITEQSRTLKHKGRQRRLLNRTNMPLPCLNAPTHYQLLFNTIISQDTAIKMRRVDSVVLRKLYNGHLFNTCY